MVQLLPFNQLERSAKKLWELQFSEFHKKSMPCTALVRSHEGLSRILEGFVEGYIGSNMETYRVRWCYIGKLGLLGWTCGAS